MGIISSINEGKTDLVEPIYESKYSIRDLTVEEIARFTTPDLSWAESGVTAKDLDLPEVNPFIPKNFDILWQGERDEHTTPEKLHDDDKLTLYYMQDKFFLMPKVHMVIAVHCDSQNYYHDPKTYALVQMYFLELNDFLSDYGYHADLVKCSWAISRNNSGMEIVLSGFNDCIPKFLLWLYTQLSLFTVHSDQPRWENLYANTLISLVAARKNEPYLLGLDLADAAMMDRFTDVESAIKGFQGIDFSAYKYFKKFWMKNIRLCVLLEGNVSAETALDWGKDLVANFERIYEPEWMRREDMNTHRIVMLPERTNWVVSKEIDLESQGNCAYLSYWEMGQGTKEFFAPGMILENLLGGKAFEE